MDNVPKYTKTIKADEPALITELISRRLAFPFAVLAHKMGLSANFVTIIAGTCWVISTPLAVIAGWLCGCGYRVAGLWVWFVCGALWNIGYILDLADGSLARMTDTSSRRGFYLDYVFHLLFKPAFLLSIGIGIYLMNGGLFWLILAVLSIPANWSAPASAAEHVLCDEIGKGKLSLGDRNAAEFKTLWLGFTDIMDSAEKKRSTYMLAIKALSKEILSYYGQFTFFSITVAIDMILSLFIKSFTMPVTAISFALLSLIFIIRLPSKIHREYKRIALSDPEEENEVV